MIVTTSDSPSAESLAKASRLADELGATLVRRGGRTLRQLSERYGTARLLVQTENELRFYDGTDEPPFYFHPSMAYVRVKRLRRGERDPLLTFSGCRPGDSVLDCTAGLGSDAIVFAYAAGAEGAVTALESEPVLCAVVREGLQAYTSLLDDVNAAFRRVRMICADHHAYLAAQPDNSVDIVYFDPMFREPIHESSSLGPLRSSANHMPLSPAAVAEAARVARRCVLLKEQRDSAEFERLGFARCSVKKTSKIGYGVIQLDQ